eukprot:768486-Hanusia_phi.AAC.2
MIGEEEEVDEENMMEFSMKESVEEMDRKQSDDVIVGCLYKLLGKMSMFDAMKHAVHSVFKETVESVTSVSHVSQFREKGVLTPEEFVAAGDMLVYKCPSWSWEAGDPSKVFPDECMNEAKDGEAREIEDIDAEEEPKSMETTRNEEENAPVKSAPETQDEDVMFVYLNWEANALEGP